MSVDLSVVVVTYRSAAFVGACLDAVRSGSAGQLTTEIVVVDNASDDGTADLVARRHPDVRLVRNRENLGFARASNIGWRCSTGRHVAFVNPDVTCGQGALAVVVRALRSIPGAAVAAPAVVNPDGTDQRTARAFPTGAAVLFGRRSLLTRWFPGNWWSRRYLAPGHPPGSGAHRVDWVSGACLVTGRATLERLGGFDEGFPMYWEDADLCRRAAVLGGTTWTVPEAVVVHREGSCGPRSSARQIRWFHQGAYRYAARHELTGARAVLRPVAMAVLAGRAAVLTAGAASPGLPLVAAPSAGSLQLTSERR